MRHLAFLIVLGALVTAGTLGAQSGAPPSVLHVYGPGGPLEPMKECAAQFSQQTKVPVSVVGGPENAWIAAAQRDADLVFGGAEYMLTAFRLRHPDFLDITTRVSLFDRAGGILVRKGNPKSIRSLNDLTRTGINIVDVNGAGQTGLWEDLAGRQGLIPALQRNIQVSVESSGEAVALWKSRPELDAWISYESWHFRLRDVTDLVRLPESERLYRGTPIAMAQRSTKKPDAQAFMAHLRSDACHEVFRRWGWR
jgi:accessory colonization factor AcfC